MNLDPVQLFVLAVLQGLTEFLPISSSGHLILVPALLNWDDQGLGFDIAVHVGSLSAILIYFRRDLRELGLALFQFNHRDSRFAWSIIVATIPLGLGGLLLGGVVESSLRTPGVIAAAMGAFGFVLWMADAYGRGCRNEYELGWRDIFLIGCSQALALIPGASRSGVTMTMGLMLGLSRAAAARFSFLLSVPAISAAGLWQIIEFAGQSEPLPWLSLAATALISGMTALLAIAAFLRLIERVGMLVFAAYRVVLAGTIVYVFI